MTERETITMREYVDVSLRTLDDKLRLQTSVIEQRLHALNDLRKMVEGNNDLYFRKSEHEIWKVRVESDIRELRESRAELAGKASQLAANIAIIMSGIGMFVAIIDLFIRFLSR